MLFLSLFTLKFLIMKRCWVLSNFFSMYIEMKKWFLSFILLIWYITLIVFYMLNQPCIPGINLTWTWFIILFICFYNRFRLVVFCFEFLHLYAQGILVCSFVAIPLSDFFIVFLFSFIYFQSSLYYLFIDYLEVLFDSHIFVIILIFMLVLISSFIPSNWRNALCDFNGFKFIEACFMV